MCLLVYLDQYFCKSMDDPSREGGEDGGPACLAQTHGWFKCLARRETSNEDDGSDWGCSGSPPSTLQVLSSTLECKWTKTWSWGGFNH